MPSDPAHPQGQCDLPSPGPGAAYRQAEAGEGHTVLLRSDGFAVARGSNRFGQCDLPALRGGGACYVAVAAGGRHTVLLRSDGRAAACGQDASGQCRLPVPEEGVSYCQVARPVSHRRSARTTRPCHAVPCRLCFGYMRGLPALGNLC